MYWLHLGLWVAYFLIGSKYSADAMKFLREPHRQRFHSPVFSPDEFTPEGEPYRRKAAQFLRWGGFGILSLYVVLLIVQEFSTE